MATLECTWRPYALRTTVDVEQRERRLRWLDRAGEENHAGAGGEHRHPRANALDDELGQPLVGHQPEHGGRLAAGQDEGVDALEGGSGADRLGRDGDVAQRRDVGLEVTLEREHPNRHHHPRRDSISSGVSLPASRPGIASLSPCETSTSLAGSCQWVTA